MFSGNYFDVLGVGAAIGRVFTPADNQYRRRASLRHPLLRSLAAAIRGRVRRCLGRAISLNGAPFTVIGVAARGFHGTSVGTSSDVFLPIMMIPR